MGIKRLISKWSIRPAQVLSLGFLSIILIGTILLNLPASSRSGYSIGFLDALFTATSATCVTGLVVVDTYTTFTLFGQIVIICLIQMGGLGFMTMATVVFLLIGKRITLKDRMLIQESINAYNLQGLVRMVINIIKVTAVVEGAGAIILCFRFVPQFGWLAGIYRSVFHAISAFCNAGFDLTGGYQNLVPYRSDILVNLVIMTLIVIGGIGYAVILDIFRKRSWKKLMLHTKIVLFTTCVLLVAGALFFLVFEISNIKTIGDPDLPVYGKVLSAAFQSVTTRTAGFNTLPVGELSHPSKLMTVILMFIGASPSSTGGGIKTTTFFLILLIVFRVLRGNYDLNVGKRRVEDSLAFKAVAILIISGLFVIIGVMAVSIFESSKQFTLYDIIIDVVSAFATVGLSSGITPELSGGSKLILIIIMFAGRVGTLTLTMALSQLKKKDKTNIRLPKDRFMLG